MTGLKLVVAKVSASTVFTWRSPEDSSLTGSGLPVFSCLRALSLLGDMMGLRQKCWGLHSPRGTLNQWGTGADVSPWGDNLKRVPHRLSEGPKWDGALVAYSHHVVVSLHVSLHFPPFLSHFFFFTLLPGITSQIKCLLSNVLWSTFGRPKLRQVSC